MSKPTPAQLAYLRNAVAVMDAGTGKGNYFSLGGPGSDNVGVVCLSRGWIRECRRVAAYPGAPRTVIFKYVVTPDGRAIVEAAKVDKAVKYREHVREHNAIVGAARKI